MRSKKDAKRSSKVLEGSSSKVGTKICTIENFEILNYKFILSLIANKVFTSFGEDLLKRV